MRTRFSRKATAAIIVTTFLSTGPAQSGAVTGEATEFTQILNNGELANLVGQSGTQISNQITQISQLTEQIDNQLKIYSNMLQNTAQLPDHVWGQVEKDLGRLQSIVQQGQGIAFSSGNIDDLLRQRFQSYSDFKGADGLPTGASFSQMYGNWSQTNRDTISGTLKAAGFTADQFSSEEATMAQLRAASQSADGQMKALQVGHEIASQQVAQIQQLRGLVSQQMTMTATWYQSEQAAKDLAQSRREDFFSTTPPTASGQSMEPQW